MTNVYAFVALPWTAGAGSLVDLAEVNLHISSGDGSVLGSENAWAHIHQHCVAIQPRAVLVLLLARLADSGCMLVTCKLVVGLRAALAAAAPLGVAREAVPADPAWPPLVIVVLVEAVLILLAGGPA
jgi:hypothetical protein